MERREFMTVAAAASAAPALTLGAMLPQTKIAEYFGIWSRQRATYHQFSRDNDLGLIDDDQFERVTEPVLAQCDVAEEVIFSSQCNGLHDLAKLIEIAATLDWNVTDYNDRIAHEARRLAS